MNQISATFCAAILFCISALGALPRFDSLEADAQEYLLLSLTNALEKGDIVLLHDRLDDSLRQDSIIPASLQMVLGLTRQRCVAWIRGSHPILPGDVCYLYAEDQLLIQRKTSIGHDAHGFFIVEKANPDYSSRTPTLRWRYSPPYRPEMRGGENFVRLFFVSQIYEIDKNYLQTSDILPRMTNETILKMESDAKVLDMEAFCKRYEIGEAFSNCVFRVYPGCVFQVDCPTPELPWVYPPPPYGPTQEDFQNWVQKARVHAHRILHLSHEEVSEIVYLAYLLEGENGTILYEEARRQNPAILLPVDHLQTEIGKRLYDALKERIESIAGNESGS